MQTMMTMKTGIGWAALALALAITPAHAQDQGTPADDAAQGASLQTTRTDSGAIIVTARRYVPQGAITASKTDIPLIQTPQSISVITRDQIDLLNFTDAQQAVRYTAGVFGENYGPDPRYDFVTVRGFTPKQYIDGLAVPATTTISATGVDLYAFQSLDILKGPSSTLYGSAPPGGILNESLRRPSDVSGGELLAKYGSHDYAELAGTVTGAATPTLSLRMTGLYRDADGEIDGQHTRRLLASPSATLKLGDSTRITALGYYQYDKIRGGAGGFLPEVGTLLPNPNGQIKRSTNLDSPYDLFERHQYAGGFDGEHRFSSDIVFHSNTKWSHYHESTPIGVYSGGGYVTVDAANPDDPANFRTLQQDNYAYDEQVKSFATDNRIDAKVTTGSIQHKLLVGVDYRNVRNVANYTFLGTFNGYDHTLDAFDPVYDRAAASYLSFDTRYNQQRLKQTGVYGQDQIAIGHLYLLASGRYDWVNARSATNVYASASTAPVYVGQKQHKFTYHLGANYVTDAGIAPYVTYSTSFEPVLGTSDTGEAFKPTSTRQWEGGVKMDARGLPSDVKLFATAALFDIRQKNFVTAQNSQTNIFGSVQGGLVEVWGGEVEVVARIREQLSINAAYSYNHSEVKSSPNAPGDIGAPLPTTPRHKISLFTDYTFQQGMLAGFGLGGGVRYNSKSAGGLPSTTSAPAVIYTGQATLFDAILHYDLPHWRIAVNGSNIFDKKYVARCSGTFGCVYGAGRQVIGTATYKF